MEAQVSTGIIATGASRHSRSLRYVSLLRTFLWCAALAYLMLCAATWVWQRHLIFEPDQVLRSSPAVFKFPVTDVAIPVVEDLRREYAANRWEFLPASTAERQAHSIHTVHGWWIPSRNPAARTVLYLHGNDGNVSTSMSEIAPLRELGYSVFMVDYGGYGRSEGGFPSEKGVYTDTEAAWDYLVHTRGINSRSLVIYGHSLGGAVAIELARRHPEAGGLVVESSFTSIYELAVRDWKYALLPVNLLLNQRFESIEKVAQLSLPVLFIHGTADEIVPFEMGLQLFRKSGGSKRFVSIDGGRHDNNAAVGGAVFRSAISTFVDDSTRPYGAGTLAAK